MARARDEAHRFANRSRSKAGKRRRLTSGLDGIAGVGPKTRQLLLRHLGGAPRVRQASDAELLAIPGVTARHIKALRAHFAGAAPNEGGASDPKRAEAPGADAEELPDEIGARIDADEARGGDEQATELAFDANDVADGSGAAPN